MRNERVRRLLGGICGSAFVLHVVVGVLGAWLAWTQYQLVSDTSRDIFFRHAALSNHVADQAQLAFFDRGLVIATAAAFIGLFYLLYARLDEPRRRPSWGWLSWFIPFANLYIPFRLAKEIDADAQQPPAASSERPASWTVFGWWVLWLASRLLGLVAGLAEGDGRFEVAALLDIGASMSSAGSALLALFLVRRWVFLAKSPGGAPA